MSSKLRKVSKYFTGLAPKRGCVKQFKAIDAEIRELNANLTHFIIQDVASFSCGNITHNADETKAKIAAKMIELQEFALTEDEQFWQEEKRYAAEQRKLHSLSSMNDISDAILGFTRR